MPVDPRDSRLYGRIARSVRPVEGPPEPEMFVSRLADEDRLFEVCPLGECSPVPSFSSSNLVCRSRLCHRSPRWCRAVRELPRLVNPLTLRMGSGGYAKNMITGDAL